MQKLLQGARKLWHYVVCGRCKRDDHCGHCECCKNQR